MYENGIHAIRDLTICDIILCTDKVFFELFIVYTLLERLGFIFNGKYIDISRKKHLVGVINSCHELSVTNCKVTNCLHSVSTHQCT